MDMIGSGTWTGCHGVCHLFMLMTKVTDAIRVAKTQVLRLTGPRMVILSAATDRLISEFCRVGSQRGKKTLRFQGRKLRKGIVRGACRFSPDRLRKRFRERAASPA